MRGSNRTGLTALAFLFIFASGCLRLPDTDESGPTVSPTSWSDRAERRLYDGAPPVIPHDAFGASCMSCHSDAQLAISGTSVAPRAPHAKTAGLSDQARCAQCHVYVRSDDEFVGSDYRAIRRTSPAGDRLYADAPPVMPHPLHMRENCAACHTGPAARPEILTSHPERARCVQCHVQSLRPGTFQSAIGAGLTSTLE